MFFMKQYPFNTYFFHVEGSGEDVKDLLCNISVTKIVSHKSEIDFDFYKLPGDLKDKIIQDIQEHMVDEYG